ncbi:hypothetical protein SCHPADRAFT_906412 [Schizopora paradoxa]|uniref:Uncharacterized protein n=1 Tax=Schizopora paradoxa TaxID=27342 RepID=A0A0H2RHB0_9AGAM|nr:hypothetical protein SCHPADRAFT_906412 [Schizopora paradoxa]
MGEENYRPLCPHLTVAHAFLNLNQIYLRTSLSMRESWTARAVSVVAKMRASADFL